MTDVVISPQHKIYFDGVEITNVMAFEFEQDASMRMGPRLRIEFYPDSVVYGEPMAEAMDIDPSTGRVNPLGAALRKRAAAGIPTQTTTGQTPAKKPPQPSPGP